MLTIKIIVSYDQVFQFRITIAAVIYGNLSIEIAAAKADGCTAGTSGSITVPQVWAFNVVVVPGAVERCMCCVE